MCYPDAGEAKVAGFSPVGVVKDYEGMLKRLSYVFFVELLLFINILRADPSVSALFSSISEFAIVSLPLEAASKIQSLPKDFVFSAVLASVLAYVSRADLPLKISSS